jgi:hypothetical protein
MSSVRRLDTEKLRTRRIIATAALTVVAITFLLLSDASAPASAAQVSAMPAAAGSSNQEAPSDPAEAEQTPAGQAPRDPAAPYQDPDDPRAQQMSAAGMPRPVRPQEE